MPYSPTTWVNGGAPALNATNLNKLKDELVSQAAAQSVSHALQTWINLSPPALSDATNLNEMERVLQVVATSLSLSYTPTSWGTGWTPARNATRMNHMELQAQANRAGIETPPPQPTGILYGIHQDIGQRSPDTVFMDLNGLLNSQMSRNSCAWWMFEPQQGVYNWSVMDTADAGLKARGVQPMWMIWGCPGWVNNNGNGQSGYAAIEYWPPPGALWNNIVARFADFAGKAANRYRGNYWEIWNEVNEGFVNPLQTSAAQYIQLYNAARTAILANDSTAKVAAGSVTGLSGTFANVTGIDWLVQMVQAGCVMDHVSIHPYDYGQGAAYAPNVDSGQGNLEFTDIALCKTALDAVGYTGDYWASEFGWSSGGSNLGGTSTIAGYVTTYLNMLKNTYTYVTTSCYFIDSDHNPDFMGYGLARADNTTLKLQGVAFRDWVAANG